MDWKSCSENGVATLRCIPLILGYVVNAMFMFAGVTAVVIIIFSGYKFIHSDGEPEEVKKASRTIYYAAGGLLLILLSFFIINIVSHVTGASCITLFSTLGFGACK